MKILRGDFAFNTGCWTLSAIDGLVRMNLIILISIFLSASLPAGEMLLVTLSVPRSPQAKRSRLQLRIAGGNETMVMAAGRQIDLPYWPYLFTVTYLICPCLRVTLQYKTLQDKNSYHSNPGWPS
jgi:hypothetical protein